MPVFVTNFAHIARPAQNPWQRSPGHAADYISAFDPLRYSLCCDQRSETATVHYRVVIYSLNFDFSFAAAAITVDGKIV
jgi:hypothetical protein